MRAVIKEIMCSDFDIKKESPENLNNFNFCVELEIGPVHQAGADLFQIIVSSHNNYEDSEQDDLLKISANKFEWGKRPVLNMTNFSYAELKNFLDTEINKIEEKTWDAIAQKINSFSIWEFDKYG